MLAGIGALVPQATGIAAASRRSRRPRTISSSPRTAHLAAPVMVMAAIVTEGEATRVDRATRSSGAERHNRQHRHGAATATTALSVAVPLTDADAVALAGAAVLSRAIVSLRVVVAADAPALLITVVAGVDSPDDPQPTMAAATTSVEMRRVTDTMRS